jgi:antirestriction protein ArdC
MKREEAKKLAEQGLADLEAALQQGASDTLVRYLEYLARFHQYSFGNVMLIAIQKPNATQVAGFHAWRKLGRWVRKGEQGILILAPMVGRKRRDRAEADQQEDTDGNVRCLYGFRVVYVFDVSQTEGAELPEFAGIDGQPGDCLSRLESIIRQYGIELEYQEPGGGALGVSKDGAIWVKPGLQPAETFAVLVHELAHELLHQRSGRKELLSRTVRETEAEAVAFVVCRALGLETTTRSADYIQLYRGNTEMLSDSLEMIQKTAAALIAQLQDESNDSQQEEQRHVA